MDSVRSGNALLQLAREHCQIFSALLKKGRGLGLDRTVTIATGCTGSAADTLVFDAMEEAYREYLPDISFRYSFNCEINDKKSGMDREIAQCFGPRWINGLCPGAVYVRRRY